MTARRPVCKNVANVHVAPSKNCLARNIQILQVFFLRDLQDLALNLAHILQVSIQVLQVLSS